jgi:hypothetical protein
MGPGFPVDIVSANSLFQTLYFLSGSRIDPVENPLAQRLSLRIDRENAGAYGTHADPIHCLRAYLGFFQDALDDSGEIIPPDEFRIVLEIAGMGHFHAVLDDVVGHNSPLAIYDHALRGVGSDIHANKVLGSQVRLSRTSPK